MRIIAEEGLFRGDRGGNHQLDLLALFRLGLARHTIEVDPWPSALFSQWLRDESDRTRRTCELALKEGIKRRARRPRARTVRVADVDSTRWSDPPRLPLASAIRLLERPLCVLLENARNDRNFLEIITRLAADFDLRKRIAERAIEVRTAGGIEETERWLRQLDEEERYSLWVMCDSDALRGWAWPKDGSSPTHLSAGSKNLLDTCRALGVRIHVLARRAIENYLPPPVVRQWSLANHQSDRRPLYEAFATLSDEQRHHYNMKKGFSAPRDAAYSSQPQNIFANLDPAVRAALDKGFNRPRPHFEIAWLFDEELLHAEVKAHITERMLVHDGQEFEARNIAQSILELL